MRHRPSNWSIFYRQQKPIFTDVTMTEPRETRKWHSLAVHSSRARFLAASLKMHTNRERDGASINLNRRRLFSQNFCCTFEVFECMYVHTFRIFPRTSRPRFTTFPSSRAFPIAFPCRLTREEKT